MSAIDETMYGIREIEFVQMKINQRNAKNMRIENPQTR